MKNIEKIGRYSIAENRGALFLRWWNPILKKTEATRLKATNLEQARTAAKQLIRVIADPSEMIMPGSNGDPTFGEVWLPFEQEKRKSLGLERFRLLENRRDLYFRAYFWNVRMSKIGPGAESVRRGAPGGQDPSTEVLGPGQGSGWKSGAGREVEASAHPSPEHDL